MGSLSCNRSTESFLRKSSIGIETVDISYRFETNSVVTVSVTCMYTTTLEAGAVDAALFVLVVHGWTRSRSTRMPLVDLFPDALPAMIPSTGTSVSIIIMLNANASIGDVRTPVVRPYVSIMCSLISLNSLGSFSSSWTSFTETCC